MSLGEIGIVFKQPLLTNQLEIIVVKFIVVVLGGIDPQLEQDGGGVAQIAGIGKEGVFAVFRLDHSADRIVQPAFGEGEQVAVLGVDHAALAGNQLGGRAELIVGGQEDGAFIEDSLIPGQGGNSRDFDRPVSVDVPAEKILRWAHGALRKGNLLVVQQIGAHFQDSS